MMQDQNTPLVSVSCLTYNHEAFIADAIEGFLRQQTPFPVEILIHDDASTDRTADIVRAYERAHPEKIRAIYQHENQYSKGGRPSHLNYSRARGKYIAFCEGDDYWTDPLKLAKQIHALESNPDVHLCFHAARRIRHGTDSDDKIIGRYAESDSVIAIEDVIKKTHGMIPTASCVITKGAAENIMKFRLEKCGARVGDIAIQIISSFPGGALYLNEQMSAYRYHVPGSWNVRQADSAKFKLQYARDRIMAMIALDAYSHGKYSQAFHEANRKRLFRVAKSSTYTLGQKMAIYREFSSCLKMPSRLMYLIKATLLYERR